MRGDSPLTQLDRLMRRGEAIENSTNDLAPANDDWLSTPPVDWVAPPTVCPHCGGKL